MWICRCCDREVRGLVQDTVSRENAGIERHAHGNIHQLRSGNIWRLLAQYSIPAIIASTTASLYNIIDRIFIGQGVGPMAIAGLALTLPLMNMAAAFGALVGTGGGVLISIRLGEHKPAEAAEILGNTLFLNLTFGHWILDRLSGAAQADSADHRGQRGDVALCRAIHADYPNWQCLHASLFRTEQRYARLRVSA